LISLLILQGCAVAPATQFYSLEAVKAPARQSGDISKPLIGITQVSLPSELERKQIVTRDKNGQLFFSEQHQWAALLKQNITEVLAKNLATQQPEFWFKAYPWSLLGMVDYRLVIDITRLEIVLGKTISLSVDWTILNEKNHTVLKHDSMNLQQPLADEMYTTAIENLNQLLVKMTQQLTIKP
jgi:uncharacterized lipoprotein YmbA